MYRSTYIYFVISNALTPLLGPNCGNRHFTNKEYVQLQTFKEPGMGWGARTVEPVTSGSLVIEYIGEVIDEAEMEVRDRRFLG